MKQNTKILIAARTFLLLILLVLTAYFAFKHYWFSVTFLAILSLISLAEFVSFFQQLLSENQKIITALLHNDFGLNLDEKQTYKNNQTIKLYHKIKAEHQANISKEILYHQLLNAVSSGFLILKEEENDLKIIFMNSYFRQLFNIPSASSWNYLRKMIPQFCETLEQKQFAELKTTIDIQINNEERQTYVIQNSKTFLANQSYNVVFLDSIQRVIDSTEKEAWMTIMKVIAHEIINSLTPIYSLASTTKMYFESNGLEKEDYEDIRLSLDTIMNRSQHLQAFVEQYRQLTMLPTPVKSIYNLNETIQEIQQSFQAEFLEKQIDFQVSIDPKINVRVDRIQFEQVLINLIKNAVYSVENSDKKSIQISAKQTENRLQIIFQDSGEYIDEAILPKIFLPFYTTRKNGAGIGLALSKSIVEAHNGYLYYQQNQDVKQFVVVLIN